MAAQGWLTFVDGKWRESAPVAETPGAGFAQVWSYYPNLIGYARIALCLAASLAILWHQPLAAVLMILVSILLDWVDGPVARAYGQCSIFGSGVDWLADLLAQIIILVWLSELAPATAPLLFLATSIELANSLFDFATTATGRYPVHQRQGGFGVILDWSMPGGSYTWFGTSLWLAYPLFTLACCLDLSWPVRQATTFYLLRGSELLLALPAVLYMWCESAWLAFILKQWREAARRSAATFADSGMQLVSLLPVAERDLLRRAWAQSMESPECDWHSSLNRKKVFWVNLWQRSGEDGKLSIPCVDELDLWARRLMEQHYDRSTVELDGYGLIANPVGSTAQNWHIDYTADYSTIFIPLTELSAENALQYAVLPQSVSAEEYRRATEDLDAVDLRGLVRNSEWVSVRQLLAPPFAVLKLDFGAIHRGIANTGKEDRVLFWVSVKKRGPLLPPEPRVQVIEKYAGPVEAH